ncbi:hypothetical protein QF026_007560 [Streptomyces aurantiacus]|nr:hypothetical protein [Streptomyces aurantiacus]
MRDATQEEIERLGRNVVDCLKTGYKTRDEKKLLVTHCSRTCSWRSLQLILATRSSGRDGGARRYRPGGGSWA